MTRLAKNILHEIVRGIFLNSPAHLRIINDIGANADIAVAAIQKSNCAKSIVTREVGERAAEAYVAPEVGLPWQNG